MSLTGKLNSGRIIYATFPDANGVNEKTRPAVLLHSANDLESESPLFVVPVTGTFNLSHPDHEIPLPFSTNPRSPAHTKLTK